MKSVTIKIATHNAAFEDPDREVARILHEASVRLALGDRISVLRDINGNVVGSVEYK